MAALLMLVPMRMALEALNPAEAVDAVLRDNLHGLELDQRCVAIAAFALALEAWRYPNAGGYRPLPRLNLAWSGQPVFGKREQWLALADGDERLEAGMTALYDTFREAPVLGSLIDPTRSVPEDLLTAGFAELKPLLERALREHAGEEEWEETAIAARGLAEAARLLGAQYHLVVTNVPYLARGKQSPALRKFAEVRYPKAKNDLANVFLERCLELSLPEGAGVTQIVMPQNWLFLTSYKAQREHLLREVRWILLARLGDQAFETISGGVVRVVLLAISNRRPGVLDTFAGLDATDGTTTEGKISRLLQEPPQLVTQVPQLRNPDARVTFVSPSSHRLLSDFAESLHGQGCFDSPCFNFAFWELPSVSSGWVAQQTSPSGETPFTGCSTVLRWDNGEGMIARLMSAKAKEGYTTGKWWAGVQIWRQIGVVVSLMRRIVSGLYCGFSFDDNVAVIRPIRDQYLLPIYAFCESGELEEAVRSIDQKLNVPCNTLGKVPFDIAHWEKVATERYSNGLPKPHSNDPTQWLFHGHPRGSVVWDEEQKQLVEGPLRTDPTVLHVAVARLLGYHWPAERDSRSGFQPLEEEREDDTPTNFRVEAASRRLETRRDGASTMELSDEARAWIDKTKALHAFEDEDGIVCLPSIRGEPAAHERLLHLLEAAWGEEWSNGVLSKLVWDAGAGSLDDWLRNQFFERHCKLFHHRPFIWHIWDGRKRDGFHVLVNYHKLAEADGKGRRLLETLTYSYLGDWIARQQDGVKRGEGGAEGRLAAALELRKRLVAIIEGESPFDIFVRWKSIEEQPIGWEPDINDGVRLNIRPFMTQDIPGSKRGAGILRAKPNVNWNKDRGKEPMRPREQFPWFWNTDEFSGERVNDVYMTVAEKRAARERAEADR